MEFYLELRSLELDWTACWKTNRILIDSVVTLSLLQMEPLESLVLRGNVQVRGVLNINYILI